MLFERVNSLGIILYVFSPGQYYGLTLEHHGDRQIKSTLVKVISIAFFYKLTL